jgi:hypothetical protein
VLATSALSGYVQHRLPAIVRSFLAHLAGRRCCRTIITKVWADVSTTGGSKEYLVLAEQTPTGGSKEDLVLAEQTPCRETVEKLFALVVTNEAFRREVSNKIPSTIPGSQVVPKQNEQRYKDLHGRVAVLWRRTKLSGSPWLVQKRHHECRIAR